MNGSRTEGANEGSSWGTLKHGLLAAGLAFPHALPLTLLLHPQGLRAQRSDLWWLAALLLLGISSLLAGDLRWELFTLAAAFLAYKGGQALGEQGGDRSRLVKARAGAFLALLGFALIQALMDGVQRVPGPAWFYHPNLFASGLLLLGISAADGMGPRWRWLFVIATLVGLVLTGSRSSLIAMFVTMALVSALDRRWRGTALATIVVGAAIVLVVSVAVPGKAWAQRLLSPVYSALGIEVTAKNLLIWTEELGNRQHWNHIGVDVHRRTGPRSRLAEWTIARAEPVSWARPQQAVEVTRGEPYTLSASLRALPGAEPGFIGWASREGTQVSFEVALVGDRAVVLREVGLEEATARAVPLTDGWYRLEFTFSVAGTGRTGIAVGVSPTLASDGLNDAVDVRELQLEAGRAATNYLPAINRSTGVGEALARRRIFDLAWQGVLEAPLYGHGSEAFGAFYSERDGTGVTPSHAHNGFLQSAFSAGVLGLAALLCVIVVLFASGGPAQRALLVGMTAANLLDSTFTAGVVLYLLAFLIPVAPTETRWRA